MWARNMAMRLSVYWNPHVNDDDGVCMSFLVDLSICFMVAEALRYQV